MGKAKSGLTLERHKAIGRQLKSVHARMGELGVELCKAYPMTGHRGEALKWAMRLDNDLSRLRSKLDDLAFMEHPEEMTPDVYYGGEHEQTNLN